MQVNCIQNWNTIDIDTFLVKRSRTDLILGLLKVSKNRNDIMKTSFLPKANEIIGRISAHHYVTGPLYHRAEILTIISLVFRRNDVLIKSFWFLLNFIQLVAILIEEKIYLASSFHMSCLDESEICIYQTGQFKSGSVFDPSTIRL